MSCATIDSAISKLRPLRLRGKGFVFDYVTSHEGIRQTTVAGLYSMTLGLPDVIHRQIYRGCFANAMTRWTKAIRGARADVDLDPTHEHDGLFVHREAS